MTLNPKRAAFQTMFVAASMAAIGSYTWAQQANANIRSVRFYTVKADRVADFQAEIKEYNAILKKGGSTRYYSMWHSLTGANVYARADSFTSWAEVQAAPEAKMKDLAADLRVIGARITQCTEESHRVVEELLPEYSLPSAGAAPKMIRVLQTKVKPDKVAEYLEIFRNEVLPAIKKSGLTSFSFAAERYGAPSTQFVSVSGMNSWADLDGGFGAEKAMGKEGYQRFLTRIRPFIVESQYDVYSFMPDVSYLPAAAAK